MSKLPIPSFYLCSLDIAQRNPGVLKHYFPGLHFIRATH